MKQVAGNGRKKSEGNNSSNYSGIVPTQFCSTSYGGAGNETVSFPARSFSSSLLNPMPISTFPLQLGHSQRIPPNSSLPINRPLGNSSSDLAWTTLALLRAATTAQQQPSTSSSATVSFANMSVQQLQGMYEQKIASLVTGALCRGGAPRADTTALVALARSLSSHTSSQILSHNHHQQQPTLNLLEGHEQWRQVMGFQNQHQNQHVQDVASTGKALNDSTKCISSLAQHDPKAVQMAAVASHTTNQRKTKRTSKSSNSGTKFTRHKKKKVQQGEDHLTRTVMTSASTPATCAPRNEYCAPRNEYCSNKLSSSENPATEPKNIKEPEMKQGFRIGTVFALPTPAHMATESNATTTINTDTSNIESKSSFLLPCRARSMPPDHNFRVSKNMASI